jgi:putative oxidoreductase
MPNLLAIAHFAGRVLLALVFLLAGTLRLAEFAEVLQALAEHGLPLAVVWLTLLIGLEAVGGLALLIGFHTRAGVLLLVAAIGLDLTLGIFEPPPMATVGWAATLLDSPLAILGGLLILLAVGPGPWAVDDLRARSVTNFGDSNVLG